MNATPPDVLDWLDYRAFLSAWFEARKAANPRFSHRLFARLAGHRSPSLLLHVIDRQRNLTETTAAAFARAMRLSAEQTAHFLALVEFDQAPTDEQRREAWARISAERRFRSAHTLQGDAYAYLSRAHLPAIRELASLPGFRDDPAWIGSVLRPAISVEEATEALEVLVRLGMLARGADGCLRPVDVSVVTPREVGSVAVHAYHREMAEKAKAAIVEVPPAERHYLGVTVAIPPELMPVLKDHLNALQARLLDLCDGAPDLKRRVVQINLHLFPLSEDV